VSTNTGMSEHVVQTYMGNVSLQKEGDSHTRTTLMSPQGFTFSTTGHSPKDKYYRIPPVCASEGGQIHRQSEEWKTPEEIC
jgi:hypothetical protein